jgi:hypothetical protein
MGLSGRGLSAETVRAEILKAIDVANLDMEFRRIVAWLGQLPAADRNWILRELEDIAAGRVRGGGRHGRRRDDTAYLLHDLGLGRVHWSDTDHDADG